MIASAFTAFVFNPLYNGLILLLQYVPYADMGIALIALTVIVKVILFPLAYKAASMQAHMKKLTPKIDALKEKHKDDKQEQTKQIMGLYKEHNVRPLLSILVLFIQLPIILGLYWVFSRGGLPTINTDILYTFVTPPSIINMKFLWVSDLGGRSIIFALFAGITQFIYSMYALPKPKPRGDTPSIKDDLARSFHLQMKYIMPLVVIGIAYTISAAIALYWTTSNLFAIAQELLVRRQIKKEQENNNHDAE